RLQPPGLVPRRVAQAEIEGVLLLEREGEGFNQLFTVPDLDRVAPAGGEILDRLAMLLRQVDPLPRIDLHRQAVGVLMTRVPAPVLLVDLRRLLRQRCYADPPGTAAFRASLRRLARDQAEQGGRRESQDD